MSTITERPRRILTVRDPAVELLLSSYPGDPPDDTGELRAFSTGLIASVRRWSNAKGYRRRSGNALDRASADAALRAALARESSR
ncbi:hypothetical protein KYN89_02365 [Alteriqipengyuania sp. NZ-12B]|uniref:Uncharacterized protein n=1 Tax=Alteriqipengyuania abyssalis TaxID=2860200 RepID=A0ABS7P9Y9_9SPHN|nr:hypothetical protein [Alteriqipengyuania abyssalis]MBY8335884.1 hypothetical protein [Alteriqipengyuania abyssalis]